MATLTIIQSGETKTLTVSTGVGAQGAQGAPGSDATVTTEAIETALGYTPANAATNTGTNTGDQDLSGLATTSALASETAARVTGDTKEALASRIAEDPAAVRANAGLLQMLPAKFGIQPTTNKIVKVGLIGDSFGNRVELDTLPPTKGMRESAYNFSSAGNNTSRTYSTGDSQTIQDGGSCDYAFNGIGGWMYAHRTIWLVQPGGGTITIQRRVDGGAWSTIHTESTAGALDVDSEFENFVSAPTGGFTLADVTKSNELRILATGGPVEVLSVQPMSEQFGMEYSSFTRSGADWDVQLAGLNAEIMAKTINALGVEMLIYSYADSLTATKWGEVWTALKTYAPNTQLIVWGQHPISDAHATYNANEAAIAYSRTWCKANAVPLFDVAAMIPDYDTGEEWGIFDGVDLIHTTSEGNIALTKTFIDQMWSWPRSAIQPTLFHANNGAGSRVKGRFEVGGTDANAGVYFFSSVNPTLSNYWRAWNNNTTFTLSIQGGDRFRFKSTGRLNPVYTDSSFSIGESSARWGVFYGLTGDFSTGLKVGSGATTKGIFSGSASLDFGSIGPGEEATLTLTVTGASTTNTPSVSLGWSAVLPDSIVVKQAWVSAANTVSVRVAKVTGGAIDPTAVTCRATVTSF